ncbi:hypothetical protein [Falsiphaeobacter marinintestinus]|uniref:hypothetical protein n=1 Tax=Falsiphaeobacter marinintestinus TaxID=1492905 RepID=UPI0011B6DB46|nr:hypothetical protein [Phaeobacter marinintestinus]
MNKIMMICMTGLILTTASSRAMAAHANSWADGDDSVVSANHDSNQAKSVGTPGQDEMNGAMSRSAHGKMGTTPGGGVASSNSGLGEGGGPAGAVGGHGYDK